jgi:DeoR/GlpR family transcriptional regulator of sugar metabolism
VVACDSSKIGKVGFARIGGLDVATTLVTDAGLADADRAWLTEAGLDVAIA